MRNSKLQTFRSKLIQGTLCLVLFVFVLVPLKSHAEEMKFEILKPDTLFSMIFLDESLQIKENREFREPIYVTPLFMFSGREGSTFGMNISCEF